MKRVLITGGNSMLGLNAIEAFIARGYIVRVIVRHTNKYLDEMGVEVFVGGVTSMDDIKQAAIDCDGIVHIAATTEQNRTKLSYYTAINVEAIKNVCQASKETSASRVVFVSTTNTIGNGTALNPSNESYVAQSPFKDNLYARSKILAESEALKSGANITIVNPSFMFGRYDTKPSSGQFLKMYYRKRIAFIPKGGKNFVAARDVAWVLVDAFERGRVGERYIAGGVNMSVRDFLREFYSRMGRKVLVIEMPSVLFWSVGIVGSFLRLFGIRSPVSWCNTQILTTREYYSSTKAIEELGMGCSNIFVAAEESLRWMVDNGVLKGKSRGW